MMAEDLSTFFSTDEFADDATIGWDAVRGIFDNAYALGGVGPSGMASTQPVFILATALVPPNAVGTELLHNSIAYTIAAHEPDGTGLSTLMLELA